MNIRLAAEADLPRVNELRAQVSELHAAGRPDIFCPGFPDVLADRVYAFYADESKHILVAERAGELIAFAIIAEIIVPENPYKPARRFLEVDELGVDEACRHQGVGRAFFDGIRAFARERGFDRIELNMWEFNENALKFYESLGFRTYRRHMELTID